MLREAVKRGVRDTLSKAGIELGGARPFDLIVNRDAFYDAIAKDGLTGARNAYVDGLCDAEHLDELTCRLLQSGVGFPYASPTRLGLQRIAARLQNRQSKQRGREIRRHYDLGNDLFEAMLDPLMNYSCGYWAQASTLAAAQEAKLELVCKKIGLRRGMRVLDVGCGFGGFARYAAERHGATVLGITISPRQLEYGQALCRGLPVELRLSDYRILTESAGFDAIVSIGMFEHVGEKNYRSYLKIMRRLLRPEGLFLLHTIGALWSQTAIDPWMDEHIFPNAVLPSASQITAACEGVFVIEDWHNFGADYDRTLMAWFENFDRHWPRLRSAYGDRFYRIWKCYLLTCAGAFRAREQQTWQVVLSPRGVAGGYRAPR